MKLEEFIANFADQFEETEANFFKADTKFRSLEEWSSLVALNIIAMVDEEFDVTIKGEDIRNSETIEDLYKIVINKL